jgi:hypothetical protein
VNRIAYLRNGGRMHSRFSSEELKEKQYLEERIILKLQEIKKVKFSLYEGHAVA